MAYESIYEDKQEEGLSMIYSLECMPLGLSISHGYLIAHTNTKSRAQWSCGRTWMNDFRSTSTFTALTSRGQGEGCMQYATLNA